MKKPESKALEFIYQDTQIHFLLSKDENVMVNATEMAKAFGKRTKDYLANQSTKDLIIELERTLNSVQSTNEIVSNRGHVGIYFNQILAIDFATWLDINFKIWIYTTIQEILFGHYKQHWDAHMKQEEAKKRMETLKKNLLNNPTQKDVIAYFEAEREVNEAKSQKQKAIQSQYRLFDNLQ
jgi:hypothetical protein